MTNTQSQNATVASRNFTIGIIACLSILFASSIPIQARDFGKQFTKSDAIFADKGFVGFDKFPVFDKSFTPAEEFSGAVDKNFAGVKKFAGFDKFPDFGKKFVDFNKNFSTFDKFLVFDKKFPGFEKFPGFTDNKFDGFVG